MNLKTMKVKINSMENDFDNLDFLEPKTFVPYGADPKMDKKVMSPYVSVRKEAAIAGYGLDKLAHDEDMNVRLLVSDTICDYTGYMEEMILDENKVIRANVASHGYGLDVLIDDDEAYVRKAVAKQGYGLKVLVRDKSPEVRIEVANKGYGLEQLIDDKALGVREAVAKQGYGFDKLIQTKGEDARSLREIIHATLLETYRPEICKEIIEKRHDASAYVIIRDFSDMVEYGKVEPFDFDAVLERWIKENPDKCALPENQKAVVEKSAPFELDEMFAKSFDTTASIVNNVSATSETSFEEFMGLKKAKTDIPKPIDDNIVEQGGMDNQYGDS